MTKVLTHLFLIFLPLSVISCSDDDKDEPKNEEQTIEGEWQCKYDAYGELLDEPLFFLFNEDGTGYEWFSDEPFSNRTDLTYTYTSSNLKIKYETTYGGYDVCNLKYELSSNGETLILYGLDDDDLSELHFTRVN